MRRFLFTLLPLALAAGLLATSAPAESPPSPPTRAEWDKLVGKAIAFLQATQEANGGWSAQKNVGVTGVVVTGLLQCGVSANDPPATKGLQFVESLVNPAEGHIAGSGPRIGLQNYVTSVNVLALAAAGRDEKYKPVIGNAAAFLRKLQWDEGEGKDKTSDFYGGAGYDSKSRPDLSNTQFFLDALKASGAGPKDEAIQKAMTFVGRCQNLQGETNDQPWAGKINDGSFIYSAAAGGSTKTSDAPDAPLTGYGSMTYAGVKSMIYAGVTPDDPRMKTALNWLRNNYTVEANPGMPPQLSQRGLYYYFHTMSKTLDLLGGDTFADAKGNPHPWRADLFRALEKRQRPDGSWLNPTDRWFEGDPHLVTGYALMALSYVRPK